MDVSPAGQNLVNILSDCRERARVEPLTLLEAFSHFGTSSINIACIVLCIPFLQPMSLGPISTAGAIIFIILGWQLFQGRESLWLPERLGKIALPEKMWAIILKTGSLIVRLGSKITRPRLASWVLGPVGRRMTGVLVMVGGGLIALPFPGVPLSNTLPALVVVSACLGQLERDGMFNVMAIGWLILSLAYFIAIIYFGVQVLTLAGQWIQGIF